MCIKSVPNLEGMYDCLTGINGTRVDYILIKNIKFFIA